MQVMEKMKPQCFETATEAFMAKDQFTARDSSSTNQFGDHKEGFLSVLLLFLGPGYLNISYTRKQLNLEKLIMYYVNFLYYCSN